LRCKVSKILKKLYVLIHTGQDFKKHKLPSTQHITSQNPPYYTCLCVSRSTHLSTDDIIKPILTSVTVLPYNMYFALALPRQLVTNWRTKSCFLCSITITLALLAVSLWYCQRITIETFGKTARFQIFYQHFHACIRPEEHVKFRVHSLLLSSESSVFTAATQKPNNQSM